MKKIISFEFSVSRGFDCISKWRCLRMELSGACRPWVRLSWIEISPAANKTDVTQYIRMIQWSKLSRLICMWPAKWLCIIFSQSNFDLLLIILMNFYSRLNLWQSLLSSIIHWKVLKSEWSKRILLSIICFENASNFEKKKTN